jgi:hypothetical protein
MAVGLNTGVPWIICKQDDALDVVYNFFLYFFLFSFSKFYLSRFLLRDNMKDNRVAFLYYQSIVISLEQQLQIYKCSFHKSA